MSFLISAACYRMKTPGVAKNVLMQLADMANDNGFAWPSIETLCMRTCWGKTAVIEALAWLEENRAIRRPERRNGCRSVYWITPSEFVGEWFPERRHEQYQAANRTGPPSGPVRVADISGPTDTPHQTDTTTGTPREPVRLTDRTGSSSGPDQLARRTQTVKNTNEPHSPLPPSGGATGFEEFFAGYPRQTDELKARSEWNRLAPDLPLQQRILEAVAAWRRTAEWQREEGRFIPKPGNWLRNQRWRDQPGVAAAPATQTPVVPEPPLTADQL